MLYSKKLFIQSLICIMLLFVVFSFNNNNTEQAETNITDSVIEKKTPEWTKNANIYEVNIRQYSTEGTFKAFEKHLQRLKEMGVDIHDTKVK